jgi:tetratricopeptide (TPR) repeat protein
MQKDSEVTLDNVKGLMRKGEEAYQAGKNIVAINYWKQALDLNPDYAPAKKRIQEVHQAMAQKQFEAGYIHYRHGELDDALDAWSNAIALDPTYKQRGLLLLMSKVELQVERDQINRLAAQGFDQYQQGNLEAALESYEELSKLEPRNEEARRSSTKIKIQLSQTALKAAQDALAGRDYTEAVTEADKCIAYGYNIESAQKVKSDAYHWMQLASQPKLKKVVKKPAVAVSTGAAAAATSEAAQPRNPEEALIHYRKGLSAIRAKDYHLASEEFDIAAQLDPTDERIYMARERAHQAWASNNADSSGGDNPSPAAPSSATP